jgi:TetR/AcrR family transcriptional regulator, transcriptional repressor of bet genes
MPRQVDHQERRQAIAEAILRLVADRGLEAASLRAVAAEAGVSMGAVQHYFTSHDEMLLFALEYGNGLLARRLQDLLAEHRPATPREAVRLLVGLLLPADDERRSGARLWAALIARACVDEPTRRLAAEAYAGLTAAAIRWITDAALAGQDRAGQSARHLVAVIEGLRWPLLFGAWTETEAMAVLDAQLDLVLGPAPADGVKES